jgi:hypothetical protein
LRAGSQQPALPADCAEAELAVWILNHVHVCVVWFHATQVKRKAWAGEYQMLYITPELATNNTAALQQLHATRRIGLIAIDEAHCVSEW